ncbi:MAG: pyruvate dehydrogenase complex dihydrolipoamide acetyltransferase [Alphaproteobacteria bacterium]|jgi:pyruvate dehydrogenase E2 component (dihydrolipoamide acetyltransferase)
MTTPILMPALSPTMEEGKLAKWHVKPGDKVRSGDVIAEIETDKATMEVEAVDEGVVETLLVPEGTEAVKVNTVIAQLREEGAAAAPAKAKPSAAARAPAPVATKPAAIPAKAPAAAPAPRALEGARLSASPLARRLAAEGGVELSRVAGSGPHGRIVKSDIEAALKGGAAKVAPAPARPQPVAAPAPVAVAAAPVAGPDARLFFAKDSYIELPHDSMRKTIARRLTSSKRDIPHYYLKVDCQIDALMDVRKQINAQAPAEGPGAYKVSVNDFVVKAAALALIRVPGVNCSWTETALLQHRHADIGVAVALDFGLITPIVQKAESKSLAAISNEVKDLAVRAKAKKLKPSEFEGGTFAISNLGMYGVRDFTAVINPPHAAILAVGAGEGRPVVRNGAIVPATVMTVQLSCDHRVIDGALGATWLEAFKGYLENPVTMLA